MIVTVQCQHCTRPFDFETDDFDLEEELHYGAGQPSRYEYYTIECPSCGKINRIFPPKEKVKP